MRFAHGCVLTPSPGLGEKLLNCWSSRAPQSVQLSYRAVSHQSNLGETLSGIGIYASGALEAVYVGDNLSIGQLDSMTQGII